MQKINEQNESDVQGESILRKVLKIDKNIAVIIASDLLVAGVDTVSNTN